MSVVEHVKCTRTLHHPPSWYGANSTMATLTSFQDPAVSSRDGDLDHRRDDVKSKAGM
jgi:hypothetical protein